MLTFNFYVGGMFGRSHFIYLDGRESKKTLKYGRTEGGIRIDLKNDQGLYKEDPKIYYKEISIVDEVFEDFIKEVKLINISEWNDTYKDKKINDGTRWYIEIEPVRGEKIKRNGGNKYPVNWRKLIRLLNEYTCERVG